MEIIKQLTSRIEEETSYPTLIYNEQEIYRTGELTTLPCVLISIDFTDYAVIEDINRSPTLCGTMHLSLRIITNLTTVESFIMHHETCAKIFSVVNRLDKVGEFGSLAFAKLAFSKVERRYRREDKKQRDVIMSVQEYRCYGRIY